MQRPQNLSAEAEKFIALLEKKAALAEAERIRADARIEQTEIKINQIAAQIKQFEAENKQIAEQNEQLIEELFQLKEKFARAIYRKFCPSAEKYYPGQPNLFDEELESIVPSEETDDEKNQLLFSEPEDTAEGKSRPRSKAGRKPLDKTLPRREIILDISDEDKKCACGSSLVKIGEERSEKLQVIPAQIYVEVTVRPKYACRTCEGSGDEDKKAVRTAALPSSILPKSIATEGLLSFLFTNKFCDHLPYYRQQKAFERIGIYISRQDMSSWQEKVYGKIKPIEKLLIEHLKKGPVIQMDETTARVFGEEDRKDEQKSYMWLARGGPVGQPVIIYRYHPTRAAANIMPYIQGFSGYLQTDGYAAYEAALKKHRKENPQDTIVHAGCLAHVRRKFFEAAKISKKSQTADSVLNMIAKIYREENALRKQMLSDEDFLAKRTEIILPLMESLHTFVTVKSSHIPPDTLLGEAVSYLLKQWNFLKAYLDCPYLTPDNNASENAVRPFVLGRKNWLFSGSPDGARSSCLLYTLIESAKANGLNPTDYLHNILERTPHCITAADWTALLPWNIDIKTPEIKGVWVN